MTRKSLHEARATLRSLIDSLESPDIAKMNEAQTRFHIIDEIIEECLNWKGETQVERFESKNG